LGGGSTAFSNNRSTSPRLRRSRLKKKINGTLKNGGTTVRK
jgi:hypothetical protein